MLLKASGQDLEANVNFIMNQNYKDFLKNFDLKLENYFNSHKKHIHCIIGCSSCCEKGDYPLSQIELEYVMQGYIKLDNDIKIMVQNNIKSFTRGEKCPFLIQNQCSIYPYRPIVCRVHGLAYLCNDNKVKVPYCVNFNKNYSDCYNNGEITINPVLENLDTPNVLKDFDYGEIRNLYDWIKIKTL